jgi:hypothetical protein
VHTGFGSRIASDGPPTDSNEVTVRSIQIMKAYASHESNSTFVSFALFAAWFACSRRMFASCSSVGALGHSDTAVLRVQSAILRSDERRTTSVGDHTRSVIRGTLQSETTVASAVANLLGFLAKKHHHLIRSTDGVSIGVHAHTYQIATRCSR